IYLPTGTDEAFAYLCARDGQASVELLEKVLSRSRDTKISTEGGWIVLQPYDPLEAARTRLSRKALQTCIQAAAERGYINLDDRAFLDLAGNPSTLTFPLYCAAAVLPAPEPIEDSNVAEWCGTAFWGTLDERQRATARQETLRLTPQPLNKRQNELILDWALNMSGDMTVQRSGVEQPKHPRLSDEPTVALADGLPNESVIELEFADKTSFEVPQAGSSPALFELDALATWVANSEHPDRFPEIKEFDLNSIRRVDRGGVSLKLILPNGLGRTQKFEESA